MGTLGLVELECPGQGVEDSGGGAGDLTTLETGVVLDAQPGKGGDLASAQSGHSTTAGGREANLVRGDASPTSGEELTDLVAHVLTVVHDVEPKPTPTRTRPSRDALSVHPSTVTSSPPGPRVDSMSRHGCGV